MNRTHVLRFGVALCQTVKGLPYQWPEGHDWTREEDIVAIRPSQRCHFCMRKLLGSPVIYPCGCSHLKVHTGMCDVYGPDGKPRGAGVSDPSTAPATPNSKRAPK